MSSPYAVIVHRSDRNGRSILLGPFDRDEAGELAERIRRELLLDAEAEILRGWDEAELRELSQPVPEPWVGK